MQGVYKITNIKNGKVYIGSSSNVGYRWNQHLEELKYNIHYNYKLQKDFNKYGISEFHFSILETVDKKKDLFKREQDWINELDLEENYNILTYADPKYIERVEKHYDILNFNLDKIKPKKIIICDHKKLNEVGRKRNSLSKSWYKKNDIDVLRKHLLNYYKNILKVKSTDLRWTTFILYQDKLAPKGVIKRFVSLTNKSIEKANTLAFMVNVFPNPSYKHKINIDDDAYAIKVLVNWINNVADINKPINIYIPSSRMRGLLQEWLNKEVISY